MIRSHVQAELDATRTAMARLRLVVSRVKPVSTRSAKSPSAAEGVRSIIALDDAYTAATGVILTDKTAPDFPKAYVERCYARSVYIHPGRFHGSVMDALERVRRGQPGCLSTTARAVTVYFSAIWPEGAVWPSDIDRPTPRKESAA